ncbi:MAG: PH domain-containing protein [Alphaproteobacteria bacterium]|nr:MAG: PH domain-containing protein [Alphaproteobacteria bacterium]
MSSYTRSVLMPGEQIRAHGVLHWVMFLQPLLLTAIGGAFAVAAPKMGGLPLPDLLKTGAMPEIPVDKLGSWLAMGVVMMGVVSLLIAFLRQVTTEIVLTNRRVIMKVGIIQRSTVEILLAKVESASIHQSILGRLMGFGNVLVHGTGGAMSPIRCITSPIEFHNVLMMLIEKARVHREDVSHDLHG